MKYEFEEYADWNDPYESVVLYGKVDGRGFGFAFAREALAELLNVPDTPGKLLYAFHVNRPFFEDIVRSFIEAGKLRADGRAILEMKELRPYFEARRAATAPA